MAVAYRSSGTIVANGDAGVDMSANLPSGLAIDDIMFFVGMDADNEHFDAAMPVGWAVVESDNTSTNCGYTVAWKRYDGTETDWVFDTPTNAGSLVCGIIHAFSGCLKIGAPFRSSTGFTVANQTSHGLTTGTGFGNLTRTAIIIIEDNVAVTDLSDADWTINDNQTTAVGSDGRLIIGTSTQTTPASAFYFTTGTNEYSGYVTFLLVPDTNRPTIVPNTADAFDFGADDTPSLEFTGSAANSYDLEYEFEILSALDATVDSYAESNQDGTGGMTTKTGTGQSFTGDGSVLDKASFQLNKTATPTGSAFCFIYAHSGTFGTSSVGTGQPLAKSRPLDVSTLTGSLVLTDFIFDDQFTLVNTTKYVIFIYNDSDGTISAGMDSSSPTHGGNRTTFITSWTAQSFSDLIFYVKTHTVELDKLSVTPDATFINTVTGGDTHPFNEAEKIDYTVQAGDALADGTWYWRARAIDPLGTNEWSDWTTIRSFLTGASGSISGTISANSVVTANLKGKGALKGIINASSTVSANLISFADISGTINANSVVTSNLTAKGQVKGVINSGSTMTCSITAVGIMKGTINCSSTVTTNIMGFGYMSATINCSSSVSCNLSAQPSAISGTINGVSTVSAILVGKGVVQATINANSGVTAKLLARGDVVGTINTSSTVSCNLISTQPISGTINTSSTVTCNIVAVGVLKAVVNANSVVTAILVAKGVAKGTINASSTVTCNLINVAGGDISGTVNASSTVTANLVAKGNVKGVINTSSTVTVNLIAKGVIIGVVNTSSTVTTNLIGSGALKGTVSANSIVTANLTAVGTLKGTINASSTVTCNLINIGVSAISGTVNASSTVTANLIAKGSILATINTSSTVTTNLVGKGLISATATPNSSVTANLLAKGSLKAVIDGVSTVTASLIANGLLQGTINASSTVTCSLVNVGASTISGTVNASSTVTGNIVGKGILKGVINTLSNVTANLLGKAVLKGIISTASTVTASLLGKAVLKGTVNASSVVTANLIALTNLSGTINGSSTVTANIIGKGLISCTINTSSTVTCNLIDPDSSPNLETIYKNSYITIEESFNQCYTVEVTKKSHIK